MCVCMCVRESVDAYVFEYLLRFRESCQHLVPARVLPKYVCNEPSACVTIDTHMRDTHMRDTRIRHTHMRDTHIRHTHMRETHIRDTHIKDNTYERHTHERHTHETHI